VLFAVPVTTFSTQYLLGMADGPVLQPKSYGRHSLPTPIGNWKSEPSVV